MNNLNSFISLLTFICLFTFCSSPQTQKNEEEYYVYTDDLERKVRIKKNPQKVIALTSSITEILYSICPQEMIVGRTQNCDYPKSVLVKPVVNNYPVDFEKLLLLTPDVVFVKEGIIPLETSAKIEQMGIPVYYQTYDNVKDIFRGIKDIGKIIGHELRARHVADSLEAVCNTIESQNENNEKPKVLMLISSDLFSHGVNNFGSDIVKIAGGQNAINKIFDNKFPQLNKEYILQIDPDIIIGGESVGLKSNFFSVYPELKKTKAYLNKKVYTVEENFLSRPGTRVVESIKIIQKLIHAKK